MFTITSKQVSEEIRICASAGVTPMFVSSPGMGKSALVQKFAEDYRLKLIDLRLSQTTPEDLNGFPRFEGNKASFKPFDLFPLEDDDLPEGHDGWLLFLDELNSGSKPVQAAAYKLILDRMVGSHKLNSNVVIVAAGNKTTDRAVVNQLSTALQSRMIHFELEIDSGSWIEYAIRNGLDHRIVSFVSYRPSKLMDFRPDHQDVTFPCPRTWEFLSRLIKDREVSNEIGARIAGTIGEGAAVEFITFAREFDRLPKLNDIMAAPTEVPVPPEASTKFAAISMLIECFDGTGLAQILIYVERFEIELQIVFCRGAVARKPGIRTEHAEFSKYLQKMVRYLQ